ncbi:hypothetical protein ACTUVN_003628 [Pseudomonas caspiana]
MFAFALNVIKPVEALITVAPNSFVNLLRVIMQNVPFSQPFMMVLFHHWVKRVGSRKKTLHALVDWTLQINCSEPRSTYFRQMTSAQCSGYNTGSSSWRGPAHNPALCPVAPAQVRGASLCDILMTQSYRQLKP